MYTSQEYNKLFVWLDTFKLWESLSELIEGVERKDILLKINKAKTLKLYVDEYLKDVDITMSLLFLQESKEWINPKFAVDYCIGLFSRNRDQYLLIKELLLVFCGKSKNSKNRFSMSYTNIVKLVCMTENDEQFDVVRDLFESCTNDLFSYQHNKRYPQEAPDPKVQAAMVSIAHSNISLENKIYVYMNTKFRKEIQIEKIVKYLIEEIGVQERDCIKALHDYWIVGAIKYVKDSGLIRVVTHNISASRLICFNKNRIHISGPDGKLVEPEIGKEIYFKIKEFRYEGDLIMLHYPCEKPEYVDERKRGIS